MALVNKVLNLGCAFACSLFSSIVEAQETRVLQCDVKGWIENLNSQQTGPTTNYNFVLEFLSNGRVIQNTNSVTSELNVTVAQTAYVFKRDAGDLFMTLDRLTGVLRSTLRINQDQIVSELGTCRPIRVAPKL
jgi:hypothetical protein